MLGAPFSNWGSLLAWQAARASAFGARVLFHRGLPCSALVASGSVAAADGTLSRAAADKTAGAWGTQYHTAAAQLWHQGSAIQSAGSQAGATSSEQHPADGYRRYRGAPSSTQMQLAMPPELAQPPPLPRKQPAQQPDAPACEAVVALGVRHSVANHSVYVAAVQKLPPVRQQALMAHAEGVARHLWTLGIGRESVARLLQHCPALFSWPAEERAHVLFSEMMGPRVGLLPAQAAEVFVRCPALGNTRHVMPSIVRLVVEQHGQLG